MVATPVIRGEHTVGSSLGAPPPSLAPTPQGFSPAWLVTCPWRMPAMASPGGWEGSVGVDRVDALLLLLDDVGVVSLQIHGV